MRNLLERLEKKNQKTVADIFQDTDGTFGIFLNGKRYCEKKYRSKKDAIKALKEPGRFLAEFTHFADKGKVIKL